MRGTNNTISIEAQGHVEQGPTMNVTSGIKEEAETSEPASDAMPAAPEEP